MSLLSLMCVAVICTTKPMHLLWVNRPPILPLCILKFLIGQITFSLQLTNQEINQLQISYQIVAFLSSYDSYFFEVYGYLVVVLVSHHHCWSIPFRTMLFIGYLRYLVNYHVVFIDWCLLVYELKGHYWCLVCQDVELKMLLKLGNAFWILFPNFVFVY